MKIKFRPIVENLNYISILPIFTIEYYGPTPYHLSKDITIELGWLWLYFDIEIVIDHTYKGAKE